MGAHLVQERHEGWLGADWSTIASLGPRRGPVACQRYSRRRLAGRLRAGDFRTRAFSGAAARRAVTNLIATSLCPPPPSAANTSSCVPAAGAAMKTSRPRPTSLPSSSSGSVPARPAAHRRLPRSPTAAATGPRHRCTVARVQDGDVNGRRARPNRRALTLFELRTSRRCRHRRCSPVRRRNFARQSWRLRPVDPEERSIVELEQAIAQSRHGADSRSPTAGAQSNPRPLLMR